MATYDNRRYYSRRRRRKSKPKRFKREMKITVFVSFCFCLFLFALLLYRIYNINQKDGDRYKKEALSQQSYTNTVLNFQRGDIKDRNNTTLAVSVRKYDIVLEPRTLLTKDKERITTIKAIAEHFQVDASLLEKVIEKKPKSMYEHVDELKELSTEQVEKFKKKNGKK